MYPRIDQVKFVEDSFQKFRSDMVCLNRPYRFNLFKDCLPKIVPGPFLNSLSYLYIYSSCKAVWRTPKSILIACQKYLLLEINTI